MGAALSWFVWLGAKIGLRLTGCPDVPMDLFAIVTCNLSEAVVFVCCLGLAISAGSNRRGMAVAAAFFLVFYSFVLNFLCSLWPALINTALGVASIDNDYLNVARVLKLGWWKKVRKIVIPSALPLIFTGPRLSLGVGWMVLIAAEMLAQNPGLGKFIWDEFQNGSSDSLGRIMVAVFTIGFIGFVLDRDRE